MTSDDIKELWFIFISYNGTNYVIKKKKKSPYVLAIPTKVFRVELICFRSREKEMD